MNPLIYREVRFVKNYRRRGQDFLIKIRRSVVLMGRENKKKHVILFCSLLNMKKQLSLVRLFFILCFIGAILSKNVIKSGSLEKNWGGGGGGVSVEEGSTSFTQYALQIQHSNDSNVEEKRFSFYKVLLLFLFFSNVLLVISLLSFLKHVTLMDRF